MSLERGIGGRPLIPGARQRSSIRRRAMRTLAGKPRMRSDASARRSLVSRAHAGQDHDSHSILILPCTLAHQAVLRLPESEAEESNAVFSGRASPRFGHDPVGIPTGPRGAGASQKRLAINRPGGECEQPAGLPNGQVMST